MDREQTSPILHFLNLLGQLIFLSILWSLCCIPMITIGTSTSALYYTVVKVLRRNQDSLVHAFFRELRDNFFQSLSVNMVFLCYFAVLAYFAIQPLMDLNNGVDRILYWLAGFAFLGTLPLSIIYPIISRFYYMGTALLRFTLMIIGRHPHIVIACAVLFLAGVLLCLSNAAAMLFVPGSVCYLQSKLLERVFVQYSAKDDTEHYEIWYGQGMQ